MVEAGGYPAGCAGREAVPGVSVREGFPAVLLAAFIARRWPGARSFASPRALPRAVPCPAASPPPPSA